MFSALVCLVRHACRIDIHQVPEDRAVRRKSCCVLQNFFKRQFIVPSKFDPPGQRREFAAHLLQPKRLIRRSSVDDGDGLCERQHAQDIFEGGGKSCATATTVSFSVSFSIWTRRCSTAVKTIGVVGNRSLAMRWTKLAAGAPMATIRSGWLIIVEGAKIFDKCGFRVFHHLAGHSPASGPESPRPLPLSAYLRANGLRVVGPRFETRTERMQHQNAFGLWISRLTLTQRRQQKCDGQRSGEGPRAKSRHDTAASQKRIASWSGFPIRVRAA